MRRHPRSWIAILCGWLALTGPLAAAPLDCIPVDAEAVAVVARPGELVKAVENFPLLAHAYKNEWYQMVLDAGKLHKIEPAIAHFEKVLGLPRRELLDQLTAGGVALGGRFTKKPAVLLIIESSSAELLERFTKLSMDVVNHELDRQESKTRLVRKAHGKTVVFSLGKQLDVAQVGSTLFLCNDPDWLEKAIDLYSTGGKSITARLPAFKHDKDTLAWTWIDLASVKRNDEQFREGLAGAAKEPFVRLVLGGLVDVLYRAPSLDLSLHHKDDAFRLSLHMPVGLDGMSDVARCFVAKGDKRLLPPLQPPRVLASASQSFDVGLLWKNRKAWLGDKAGKDLDEFEFNAQRFLRGTTVGELLDQAGWNQRFVAANPGISPYKTKPAQPLPAFAVVLDLRDTAVVKTLNTALRAAGLAGTFKFGLRYEEKEHAGHKVVSYYFRDDRPVPEDPDNYRFNFSPSFVQVGNQFVVSSTAELARDLVDTLEQPHDRLGAGASYRFDVYSTGLAAGLKSSQDKLLVNAILEQGLPPSEAGRYIDSLIELVDNLGVLHTDIRYTPRDYRVDVVWSAKK